MGYSKRWELIHILGGKCVDCNNENFYDLELDHINDDGDGERRYYTKTDAHYISNPQRARERLAVRCKDCHEKRHHPPFVETDEMKRVVLFNQMIDLHIQIIKSIEGTDRKPIPEKTLIEEMRCGQKISEERVRKMIGFMLRRADIYESKIGCYNTV